jgi:hypothetical protein
MKGRPGAQRAVGRGWSNILNSEYKNGECDNGSADCATVRNGQLSGIPTQDPEVLVAELSL